MRADEVFPAGRVFPFGAGGIPWRRRMLPTVWSDSRLLLEFADDDLEIVAAGPDGDVRLETTLGALMPHAFRLNNFL
jgi:hypothetical protein